MTVLILYNLLIGWQPLLKSIYVSLYVYDIFVLTVCSKLTDFVFQIFPSTAFTCYIFQIISIFWL